MGSQTKYNTKSLVFVNIDFTEPTADNPDPVNIKYGFSTNIPASYASQLGHTPITNLGNPPLGLVVGSSFPKPRRASKRDTSRMVSSFIAVDKQVAAKKAGYKITRTKAKPKLITRTNSFVQTVFVTIRGIRYAWNIPKVSATNAGDLAALGIRVATADDANSLVFGANFPRPPRATKIVVSGDEIKNITTFYDPSVDPPSGWTLGGGEISSLL